MFTGIENMNTTIDIKLKEGAIPYVAPIHHVAHALQEPLRLELEKLVDEGILQKLKIDEKSEWLNLFVCAYSFVLESMVLASCVIFAFGKCLKNSPNGSKLPSAPVSTLKWVFKLFPLQDLVLNLMCICVFTLLKCTSL